MRCGGGGSSIALCRDLVVMADDARIRYMTAWVPAVTARATNEIFTARIPSLLASKA
jgi:enoyl-CoA hydratase/carnithine racemase